jgi:hypothetical protein
LHYIAHHSNLLFSVSYDMCEEIAKICRKLQRIGSAKVLFLDETHKREGDVDRYTIVLPGESPFNTINMQY